MSVNRENFADRNPWAIRALGCARIAYEKDFSSRRGVYVLGDVNALVIYNNNPYAAHPTLRDLETEKFRQKLAEENLRELAYATYPTDGDDAGYSYAMIIEAGEEWKDWVIETLRKIVVQVEASIPSEKGAN